MTKLSIVTVNKNNLVGLKRTYESIRRHMANTDLEWIVIDGDSGKETVEFLENVENLVKWISESDNGIYDAMNKGLKLVTGDFVWFLNSGDTALNLPEIYKYLGSTDPFQIVICNWKRDLGIRRIRRSKYVWTIYHSLPTRHQAILYSVKSIGTNRYSLNFKIAGDFEFTTRIWKANKKAFIRVPLVICEFESGGTSSRSAPLLASEAWEIQRSILHLPKVVCGLSRMLRMRLYWRKFEFLNIGKGLRPKKDFHRLERKVLDE